VRLLHAGDDHERQAPARQDDKNPNPSEEEVRWGISGNLCRCTGYNKIVEAVQYAADKINNPAPDADSEEAGS